MSEPAATPHPLHPLPLQSLTAEAFAPFGAVIPPLDDGVPFGPWDAQLDLGQGIPRFYAMRLDGPRTETRWITRHRRVTQALASVGGKPWWIIVAPPSSDQGDDVEPALEDIRAFHVPGDVAIMFHRGTWHAGPFFDGPEASFFNLELSDTNIVDHQSCDLARRHGVTLIRA